MRDSTHERPQPQTQRPDPALGCPRYARCSAPHCPAIGGVHLKGERVCFWLREAVKAGGSAKIRGSLAGDLAEAVLGDVLRLLHAQDPLADALRKAAQQGSKVDSGRRLQHVHLDALAPRGAP